MNGIQNNIIASNTVGDFKFICQASGGAATETTVRSGWLECNGAVISRTTYSALSSYLGGLSPAYPFGAGDGSTTFALPDLRGRLPIHHASHTTVSTIGNNDGVTDTHRRPKHRHTGTSGAYVAIGGASVQIFSGGSGSPNGSYVPLTVGNDTTNDPLDAPAYLVSGIWIVKY
jgi:microcystin-dependent protein